MIIDTHVHIGGEAVGFTMNEEMVIKAILNVPVVSHTGNSEVDSPKNLYNAAKLFPKIKFVMVHMGLERIIKKHLNCLEKLIIYTAIQHGYL